MTRLRAFVAFLGDFVLGDDPLMFVLVCAGLGATGALEALGVAAWWLVPVGVVLALVLSVRRARPTT
jgi:hypothetical protein